MLHQVTEVKQKRLDKIISAAAENASPLPNLDAFIQAFFARVAIDDLQDHTPATLAEIAARHLQMAQQRDPQKPLIDVFVPTEDAFEAAAPVLMIHSVTDDMPFLVDSLGLVVNAHGLVARWTVHPAFNVERNKQGKLLSFKPTNGEDPANTCRESHVFIEAEGEFDQDTIKSIKSGIAQTLLDVRAATEDWDAMRDKVSDVIKELDLHPPSISAEELLETKVFLEWLAEDHFTFLGYREYQIDCSDEQCQLRANRDSELGLCRLRDPQAHHDEAPNLSDIIRREMLQPNPLIITKANSRSTVHRPTYLDYVGIKTYNKKGEPVGEKRFLGLFTSAAYSQNPRNIPLLRRKFERVVNESGLDGRSHLSKRLMHVLASYPRDELFQSSVEELSRISEGILSLQERQRVKLFVRPDVYQRYYSCLIFVPKDKYNTKVRKKIERILRQEFDSTNVDTRVSISESILARMHTIVRVKPGSAPPVPINDIENSIREAVRTWQDRLREALLIAHGAQIGTELYQRYGECFPAAFRENVAPDDALDDIAYLEQLRNSNDTLRMHLYRPHNGQPNALGLCLYHQGGALALSDMMPILDNMGLRVLNETPYHLIIEDQDFWAYDFDMRFDEGATLELNAFTEVFIDTFSAAWEQRIDNDRFNRLTIAANLNWQNTRLLRGYAAYLSQIGVPFGLSYIQEVLNRNSHIGSTVVAYFISKFDPTIGDDQRFTEMRKLELEIESQLEAISRADDDRLLRLFVSLVNATIRTNFFQPDETGETKRYLSFKFDPTQIPGLPKPNPMFEVFVYGRHVEGVHLRGGKIARGGLRWSDRREDYRTEVLGLMKAQMVKNTLIVPVGAKGGFFCRQLPSGDRDAIMTEAIRCYKDFVRGLLDITDNYVSDKLTPPDRVVRHDDDDPYLVVAADKGTATFSDTANQVAAEYNYWLGDAFASGGSVGYDHKKMGITAKGGWEAVKRHFRELGTDIQNEDFTVVGIGDMSGDVFGNGLLRSRHIKLQAAFNHMHIFLDPTPDPALSFNERERLFELPRSSWADYANALISPGGGVYSLNDKKIELSPEVRLMLDVKLKELTPQEMIQAILKMPADLLWNGGIGTYIKASGEAHSEVGDRSNDGVRVDASDLRCRVIGEGGNLGVTQRGRIEFALAGGRINTDFIDNSAGVDCSDHEVNIKILCDYAGQNNLLTSAQRDDLLAEMANEVEILVLRNNYLQTQAISMIENHAVERVSEYATLIRWLERSGDIDRELEFLPSDDEIAERPQKGQGLTRPELSVLVSYSKIGLYNALLNSDIPEDPYLSQELKLYFPKPLQNRFADLMINHRLKREIVVTQITNSLIHRMGPSFARRTMEETGASAEQVARAYTISREVFGMRQLWTEIQGLDNVMEASAQYSMYAQTARLLRRASLWLLTKDPALLNIAEWVDRFKPGVDAITERLPQLLVGETHQHLYAAIKTYSDLGVPNNIAQRLSGLGIVFSGLDIADIANDYNHDVVDVADVYFQIGTGLRLDWLREAVENLSARGHWQAMARGSLRDNVYDIQRRLTAHLVEYHGDQRPKDAVSTWLQTNVKRIQRAQNALTEMQTLPNLDFATLSVALQELRKLF